MITIIISILFGLGFGGNSGWAVFWALILFQLVTE